MGSDLPLRSDTVFLYRWNRDGLGDADYSQIADDSGNAQHLISIDGTAGQTGPMIQGGRRHALGQSDPDFLEDFSWSYVYRYGYLASTSGLAAAAALTAAKSNACTLMGWAFIEKYGISGGQVGVLAGLSRVSSPDSETQNNTLFSFRHDGSGTPSVFYEYGAGVNQSASFSDTLPLQEWFHWAITKELAGGGGWDYKFYRGGVQQGVTQNLANNADGGLVGQTRWNFGTEWYNAVTNQFSGRQQDVAFFDATLTPGQVAAFAVRASDFHTVKSSQGLTSNLVGHWIYNESPHGIDEGPGGHHVRDGDSTSPASRIIGSILGDSDGGAISCDWTGDVDKLEGTPAKRLRDFIVATDWTFLLWMTPSTRALLAQHALVHYGGLGTGEVNNLLLQIYLNSDWRLQIRHEYGASVNQSFTTTDPLAEGSDQFETCMIAVRKSVQGAGVKYEVFFNGRFVENSIELINCTGSLIDDNTQMFMMLGSGQTGVEGGLGIFGSIAMYSSGLTDQEILDLYNSGLGIEPVVPYADAIGVPPMTFRHSRGDTINIYLDILENGAGVTGMSPTAAIQRQADGKWYKAADGTWVSTIVENPMSQLDVANLPGRYYLEFDQSTDTLTESTRYTVKKTNTSGAVVQEFEELVFGPLAAAIAPGLCSVQGTVLTPNGKPEPNAEILATLIPVVADSIGNALQNSTVVRTYTNRNGDFDISLTRGAIVRLEIGAIGYDRRITIPDAATALFTDL